MGIAPLFDSSLRVPPQGTRTRHTNRGNLDSVGLGCNTSGETLKLSELVHTDPWVGITDIPENTGYLVRP